MLPAILQDIEKVERTVCGFQDQLDHADIIAELALRIGRYGVQGRLILDKDNFFDSSCARQPARVNELHRAGCLFRVRKPPGGQYACVHVKCLILDEKIMLSGSMNLTHNGLQYNKEHLYRMSEPSFIGEALADFEKEWLLAEPVTDREIKIMLAKDQSRKGAKRDKSMTRTIDTRPGEGTPSFVSAFGASGYFHGQPWIQQDGRPVAYHQPEEASSSVARAGAPELLNPSEVQTLQKADRGDRKAFDCGMKKKLATGDRFTKGSVSRHLLT
jgi:hypothetical protein